MHLQSMYMAVCFFVIVIWFWVWTSWPGFISQVHGGGGGYDSDFSDDEQGQPSEKALKR